MAIEQQILLKRSSTLFDSQGDALNKLKLINHKKGEPVIVFYNDEAKAGKSGGLSNVGAILAVGTKDAAGTDKGGYQVVANYDDYVKLTEEFVTLRNKIDAAFQINFRDVTQNGQTVKVFDNVQVKGGMWADTYVSASGQNTEQGGGTGGATTLAGLTDVDETVSPTAGAVLTYNGTTQKWEAKNIDLSGITNDIAAIKAVNTAQDTSITTINNTLSTLTGTGTGSITDTAKKVKIKKVTTGLGTNELAKYKLQFSGADIANSDEIVVYKDNTLKEVYLGASTDTINTSTGAVTKNPVEDAQSLNFAYRLTDGTYTLVKIDVSKFLTQSEFGNGLDVSDAGKVSVKLDSTSQSGILSVSGNGIKIDGVATGTGGKADQTKGTLTIDNGDTNTPNATFNGSADVTITKANIGLGKVDNKSASEYLTAFGKDTNNTVLSITVGGTTKSITKANLATLLGLQAFAYAKTGSVTGNNQYALGINSSQIAYVQIDTIDGGTFN